MNQDEKLRKMRKVMIKFLVFLQKRKLYRCIDKYGLNHQKTYKENVRLDKLLNLKWRGGILNGRND